MGEEDEREGLKGRRTPGSRDAEPVDPAEPVVTRELAAEAAVWIARLHGPSRSRHLERACLAWQAKSAAHRLAFERCTDLWMDVALVDRAAVARAAASVTQEAQDAEEELPQDEGPAPARPSPGWGTRRRSLASAAALTAVLGSALAAVLVFQPWRDLDTYDTGIGEQRRVVLGDGTQMSLNTATRVKVALSQTRRQVSVEGGEAFFEVAKDPSRPFVVKAAGTEVTATGTAFGVRLTPADAATPAGLDVTLVEGQVVVRETQRRAEAGTLQPIVMAAGERLRVRGQPGHTSANEDQAPVPQRDRPRLDQVLAWKRGEVVFDNTALQDALAEMNRYSAVPITAAPELLQQLRISGQYRTGDNRGFAQAVAALHGLVLREQVERLELLPR